MRGAVVWVGILQDLTVVEGINGERRLVATGGRLVLEGRPDSEAARSFDLPLGREVSLVALPDNRQYAPFQFRAYAYETHMGVAIGRPVTWVKVQFDPVKDPEEGPPTLWDRLGEG